MFSGERLKAIRKDRGLTLAQLAEVSGLTPAALSMFETESRTPNATSLIALCTSLKVSADVLLGIETGQTSPMPLFEQNIRKVLSDPPVIRAISQSLFRLSE